MSYQQHIHNAVVNGVAGGGLTNEELTNPLIDELARLIVGAAVARPDTSLDGVVEIARHRLDQKVADYAYQIRPR